MSLQAKLLNLTSMKQLVDINQNYTNFKCDFHVVSTSTPPKPFEIIVINQRLLDQKDDIDFMYVENGETTGEFTMDKNIYDNWFIALRASDPTTVSVKISTEPLEINEKMSHTTQQPVSSPFPYLYLKNIVLVLLGLFILYNLIQRRNNFLNDIPIPLKNNKTTPSLLNQLKSVNLQE